MHKALIGALVLSLSAPAAFAQTKPVAKPAAAGVMKPGLWEIVSASDTAGSLTKRSVTARACYSADDVGNLPRILPQQRETGMKCELRDPKLQGVSASWHVVCTGKDSSPSGNAQMTMGPDAYTGEAELELKKAGSKPVKVVQKVTGKWIEACK